MIPQTNLNTTTLSTHRYDKKQQQPHNKTATRPSDRGSETEEDSEWNSKLVTN